MPTPLAFGRPRFWKDLLCPGHTPLLALPQTCQACSDLRAFALAVCAALNTFPKHGLLSLLLQVSAQTSQLSEAFDAP